MTAVDYQQVHHTVPIKSGLFVMTFKAVRDRARLVILLLVKLKTPPPSDQYNEAAAVLHHLHDAAH